MGNPVIALLPLLTFFVLASRLSVIDLRTHRLPNRHVAQLGLCLAATELLVVITRRNPHILMSTMFTTCCTVAVYGALFVISRGALGMGDVKFSITIGLLIGFYAPSLWLMAIWLSFSIAAGCALAQMVWKRTFTARALRTHAIAFGPFMTVSAIGVSLFGYLT